MKHPKLVYIAQAIAAMILLMAASMKFMGEPGSLEIFVSLDMEPGGRYLIGVIELATALLLLTPLAAFGSVIAVGVMCGAIIAHVTELGLVVNGDGGRLVGLLVTALVCASYIMVIRRKEIPLVGGTL